MKNANGIRYYRNWILTGSLVLGMLFGGAMEAGAVSSYYSQFQSAYPSSSLSALSGNARCNICHPTYPSSTARNAFGTNFASNGHAFNATLNNMDSDGDGFSNITEINAGTYPGDASSTPAPVAGALSVSSGSLSSSGTAGGPFSPVSQSFTLSNGGGQSIAWTASKAQSWTTLSSSGGTLAAGASATVTVSINSGANSLAAGPYSDTVTFTNTTNGTGNATRSVSLTVTAVSPPP